MEIYRENTGDTVSGPMVIGGGTYARALSCGVAFGPRFPGKPEYAHQKNECIDIEDLMLSSRIYADAIYELTKRQ